MLHFSPDSTLCPAAQVEHVRGLPDEQGCGHIVFDPKQLWYRERQQKSATPDEPQTAPKASIRMGGYLIHANHGELVSGEVKAPEPVTLEAYDPWLVETWELINAHRGLTADWDGMGAVAPNRECLDAAEAFATLVSAKPMTVRPQFAVDSRGRPSFAAYGEHLYLHLTVDAPDRISWYAVIDGEETFEDEVVFNGVELPAALNQLL
jgi:hypothetical protein